MSNEEINFYSNETKMYDDRFKSVLGKWINSRQQEIVHGFLVGDGLVVDLACGTGRFLNRMGDEALGVEASDMIYKTNGRCIRADANHIALVDGCVDYVVCVNAFNHFSNYKNILKEISRILKPNGLLLLNFSNLLSPAMFLGLFVNLRNRALFKDVYTRWDSYVGVKKLFRLNNFKIVSTRGMTFLGLFSYSVFVEARKTA